ncbi:hypothetical protein [uncultured Polaribacter sp.]|uniref:hypothetical protein n=1 Tax=uncultured Polaribacter sp. TaxID=174711 RepID=UPI002638403F|nr:hypothetical protein [uncultured Polaribacter sp.]
MSTTNKNEEEVDLGSLFVIIGKGFKNFFNFIGSIFKGIFHFIITILIFLKANIIKIGIATIIGAIVGVFIEVKSPTTYESELLLEPNFKSTRQLYNNINYYNNLVKQKDTIGLANTFNIDKQDAASLKKFEISPVINDNDIINSYDQFIEEVDTLTVKSYSFQDFKTSFSIYDYNAHKVRVVSEKNDIFNKLDAVIISSIVKNTYFNKLKSLANENLNRTDSLFRQNLTQIDSLRKVYVEVMLQEARKPESNGTNIDLGGVKKTTKELELFETNIEINEELVDVNKEKGTEYEVINVLSNFQPIGTKLEGVSNNYAFLLGGLGAVFMILILVLAQLNAFLISYKK